MNNLIIRVDKVHDLVLSRNMEGVYFLYQYGQMIFNNMDYNIVSDEFNKIIKEK